MISVFANNTVSAQPDVNVKYLDIFSIFYIIVAACGFLGNILLLIVILKSNLARNRGNLLVVILAAVDLFFSIYFIHTRIAMLTRSEEHISTRRCFFLIFYALFAEGLEGTVNLALAVDRIIRLIAIDSYDKWSTAAYLFCLLFTAIMGGIILPIVAFAFSSLDSVIDDQCIVVLVFAAPVSRFIFVYYNLLFAILVTAAFVVAQAMLKLRRGRSAAVGSAPLYLLNTISIITLAYVVNFLTVYGCNLYSESNRIDDKTKLTLAFASGFSVLLSCNCTFVVYTWRSEQFRSELFMLITCKSGRRLDDLNA